MVVNDANTGPETQTASDAVLTQWRSPSVHGFHVMAKPIGPMCNLNCEYCYYLQKNSQYKDNSNWRMSDDVLTQFIEQYIEAQPETCREIEFVWQGGEPTLLGIPFFEKAITLQKQFCPEGKRITNAIQTNSVLIDDDWASFLKEHSFLVGVSIDGPKELHNRYRQDKSGNGSFDRVMAGIDALQKIGVEINALATVNRVNSTKPAQVYSFLKDIGFNYVQFIPIVEPIEGGPTVTDRSVQPSQWGRFLIGVFDQWVRKDVGRTYVQIFDQALGAWMGVEPTLCIFAEQCGRGLVLEHNGDVYSCDHFVSPEHRLGNITDKPLQAIVNLPQQARFGLSKSAVPQTCRDCGVWFVCHGGCPKNRLVPVSNESARLNYLCEGYKAFFKHIEPYMESMAAMLRRGQSAAAATPLMQTAESNGDKQKPTRRQKVGRNDPCSCGSGKKYKKCCGR